MSSILIGYIMNGKAGGTDTYLMSILQPLSEEYSVTLLTSQKDDELDKKNERSRSGTDRSPQTFAPFFAVCSYQKFGEL